MKEVIKRKPPYTPETIGGACMTGRVMSDAEVIKISSYIIQYKARQKADSAKKIKTLS